MIWNLFFIFIGGGMGSICRFGFSKWFDSAGLIPWPTLMANIASSLILGVLLSRSERDLLSSNQIALLMIGFCGGFSTFSSFSLENFELLRDGHYLKAAIYISLSVILCITAIIIGYMASEKFKN